MSKSLNTVSCFLPALMLVRLALEKWPQNSNDILHANAKSDNYLMEKCQSEHHLQLSFKYFVKSFSISKLSSKISEIQTTISGGIYLR